MRLPTALAVLAALAGPAAAQDLGQARAFVEGLYAAYAKEPGPDYLDRQAKEVFSPAVLDLLRRDAASTPQGDVGALDGDPICNCQDYGITNVHVAVSPTGADTARAEVDFLNFDKKQHVALDLVRVQGQWRVGDIHAEGTPSLVGLLNDSLKAHAK
jgi:uncharacterized protein DUF3828